MNFGLRAGQLMAARSEYERTDPIERDRLWYRLERIGKEQEQVETQETPPQVVEHIHRHSDMGRSEFNLLQEHDRALKYLLAKQKEKDGRKRPKGEY